MSLINSILKVFVGDKKKKDLKLLYHYMTPKDIYVKYISYGLGTDNSIMSNVVVECIKPDSFLRIKPSR